MAAVAAFVYGYEQPVLSERFGAEYEEYRRNVPAWWPRLRPWTSEGASSGRPTGALEVRPEELRPVLGWRATGRRRVDRRSSEDEAHYAAALAGTPYSSAPSSRRMRRRIASDDA